MKKITKLIAFALSGMSLLMTAHTHAQTYELYNFAGDAYGSSGYSGDGGAATAALLKQPMAVCADASGNVYIADYYDYVIRKVNTSGTISTIAGNYAYGAGFSGDGGPATAAELTLPYGVAVDGLENVYMSNESTNRIRKVNTSGIISTMAGNGVAGYSGDGGAATNAEIRSPAGVAADGSGNIYVADLGNGRVRKINNGGVISTIAGNGVTGFSGDGGLATAAELHGPTGVALDALGNIFIADEGNNIIRMVNTSGIISTIAGNSAYDAGFSGDGGPATNAELNGPWSVTIDDSNNIFIADAYNQRIRKVNSNGIISTVAGDGGSGYSGSGIPATVAHFFAPAGVTIDNNGILYIADGNNHDVSKTCFNAPAPASILGPASLCLDASQTYSVIPIAGATSYKWTLPTGWTGSSTTNSISVSAGATSGNITVEALNDCGTSSDQLLTVTVQTPPNASICYVSVDTSSTYNEIYWDKSTLDTLAIDSFQVYRQVLTNYVEVGSVAANAFPSFIDYGSTPNSNSSLYEIGVLDTCGEVGIDSVLHDQTILLQASLGVGNVVNLSWNAYTGTTVNYYRILRDSTGMGNWQRLDSVSSSILAYTDLHPPVSNNLQYVITTDWNLSCRPGLVPIRHGLYYSLSSYSNKKKLRVTGINGIADLSSAIEVYPNPVANTLFISINQPIDGNLTILNVLGEEIYNSTFTSKNQNTTKQISLSGLSSGVYILKIESKGQTLVKKFVKM